MDFGIIMAVAVGFFAGLIACLAMDAATDKKLFED